MSDTQKSLTRENAHTTQKLVLVVEDDDAIAEMLVQTIQEETSHRVLFTADTIRALQMVQEIRPDLLMLNYHLPSMTGIELYDKIAQRWGDVPTIMLSANLPQNEVVRRNIVGMHKPFELDELLDTIENLLAQ